MSERRTARFYIVVVRIGALDSEVNMEIEITRIASIDHHTISCWVSRSLDFLHFILKDMDSAV